MIIVTLQRKKCIGCNYCEELAKDFFRMSKKDGKTVLINSVDKKGFFTLRIKDNSYYENLKKASEVCPVKIISVSIL